ncbi:TPA: RNA-guided pseudouridylation complex pseudouridine synthase subunit Cbf5 [Candidatus Woesearchaeota archaeon]|nr:RNA-guided pseudouridylation complex pseudouridine synthase subunit Cbf5 [Candidatus Woesearchaeota archaeon]
MTQLPFEKITRKILIKRECETSEKYGHDPNKRPIEKLMDLGIINVDKPKGPTSHQVSAYVQKIVKTNKSGHSGTLDPKVTGVLPVAIGKGTRIVQTLLIAGKEYVCIMHLHKEVPEKNVKEVMQGFVGKIDQLPPIKSAVKREWRQRTIYYIDIHEVIGQDVLFTVGCQAGTYIRKLCHDVGQKLGVGAHMAELRRTKAGPFKEDTLKTLSDLQDAYWFYKEEGKEEYLRDVVQPVERAVEHLPKVWIMDSTVDALTHGADLAVPGIAKLESGVEKNKTVAIMTLKEELVALGDTKMSSEEMMKYQKGIAVKTKKVFMEPGLYPRMQKKEN